MAEGKRGRPEFGTKQTLYVKFNISIPPEVAARLEKYCEDDERAKSWVVSKALDQWLKGKGY